MGDDEKARLKTMVSHWLKHNEEHTQEFREWAVRAREMGEPEAGQEILAAAQEMDKASEALSRALRSLERREG
jgi:hypothetical protein